MAAVVVYGSGGGIWRRIGGGIWIEIGGGQADVSGSGKEYVDGCGIWQDDDGAEAA